MTSVDKAGEPSMEEALASVRQLIADVPEKNVPEKDAAEKSVSVFPALEPNPLVPQAFGSDASVSGARAVTPEATPPAPDRLSGVLKSGALPATRPFGSKRPMPFDQDLADMLDETAGDAAPKPSARAEEPATGAAPAPKASVAPEANAPSSFPLPSLSAPAPFSIGAAPTAAAPPPPTRTFGFPPLRKSSFYPPQPTVTPTLPPLPAVEAAPAPSTCEPAAPNAKGGEPGGNLDEALKRLSNLGAVVPGAPVAAPKPSAPMPSLGAPHVSESPFNGSALGAGRDTVKPVPAAAHSKIDDKALWHPVGREEAKDPVTSARDRDVTIPEAAPKPAVYTSAAAAAAPLPKTARESDPSTVAAQALDALAQGLAASGMTAAVAPKAAPALVEPAVRPEVAAPGSTPTLTMPESPPAAAPASARTLEDVVADMLRPMLQQWVSDNMPRIMERALRVELEKSLPSGQKPPGG